ncbi:MAG: VWA domain-containing protein [Pirellulales bacterium]
MSGTLPTWIERALDVNPAETGEGTVWTLEGVWDWAPWVTLLFVGFSAAFVVYLYARESSEIGRRYKAALVALRLALVAVAMFMIAQVVLLLNRTGLPYAAVVIDDSASMGLADRYDDNHRQVLEKRLKKVGLSGSTRINLAKTLLLERDADLLAQLNRKYKLKVYFLDGALRAQPGTLPEIVEKIRQLEPTGESTRLGTGVRAVLSELRGTPPAAVVLLTDGITTDGETLGEAAAYARRRGVPLFSVGLGSEEPTRDLELSDLLVDDAVFVDDIVNFEFKLTGTGFAGRRAKVVLRDADDPKPLAQIEAIVGPDGRSQSLRLPYRPTKVGQFEYIVEVEVLKGESRIANNRQSRVVQVRKERIRVLLVAAYPTYEFRYLKNMLQRDSTIELKTVLQDADAEYAETDKTALGIFPVGRDALFAYDVILFGDVNPGLLNASALDNLAAFVTEKGGGLIVMAGPWYTPLAYRNTPLATLLPVDLTGASDPGPQKPTTEGFRPVPTDQGLASPPIELGDSPAETERVWRSLPELYWLLRTPNLKPAAKVLAETSEANGGRKWPVFTIQYVAAGKVLFHATDDTWRWRYRLGDAVFARYWVQAIRYLSRGKLLGKDRAAQLSVDRREYRAGEPVQFRLRFFDERLTPAQDDGATVVVESEGGKNQRVKLRRNATHQGVFEGGLSGLAVGSHHAWLASPALAGRAPAVDFRIAAPPGEFERTQMDAVELKRAADQTKGRFYRMADAWRLLDAMPEGRQVPIEALPPRVLWNRWPVLFVFLVLLTSEWVLRRRKGML